MRVAQSGRAQVKGVERITCQLKTVPLIRVRTSRAASRRAEGLAARVCAQHYAVPCATEPDSGPAPLTYLREIFTVDANVASVLSQFFDEPLFEQASRFPGLR